MKRKIKKIPIEKEIKYIENYIGLQELKFSNEQEKISLLVDGSMSLFIQPLLLIPFVENAFKHGNLEDENSFIKIELNNHNGAFSFILQNSFDPNDQNKDDVGGVGLENVRSRLIAHYRDKHSLEIKKEGSIYVVELNIPVRMKYTCLIADDEMPARELLTEYVQQMPQLQLVAKCKNGVEVIKESTR